MYHHKKSEMLAMLDTLMGGRAAEELIFGSDYITSGASDDLRKASDLASNMVKVYGMSEKVGLRYYGKEDDQSVFGGGGKDLSPTTAEVIDSEIRRILQVIAQNFLYFSILRPIASYFLGIPHFSTSY